MAAFERIESGIPEMDKALDNIRLGVTQFGEWIIYHDMKGERLVCSLDGNHDYKK